MFWLSRRFRVIQVILRVYVLPQVFICIWYVLGFSVEDKYLKRAGLDYWHLVDIHYYDSVYEVLEKYKDNSKFLLTTKAHKSYSDVKYDEDSLLIFGKETAGLPEKLRNEYPEGCVRIPMRPEARSLNLSNSVAIVAYEAMRQVNNFADLSLYGNEYVED